MADAVKQMIKDLSTSLMEFNRFSSNTIQTAAKMQDYTAFTKQRLRACYLRRQKYPVKSAGWILTVTEARMFLQAYRLATGRFAGGKSSRRPPLSAE